MQDFKSATFALLLFAMPLGASAQTPLPDAIAATGEAVVLSVHAEGETGNAATTDALGPDQRRLLNNR